jgi:RNA polymerase sigma-70 factor (ECF subfamily)
LEPQTVATGPLPDRVTDIRGLNRALREAIATLPERQRAAVVLFDVEGYSHREIGAILDIPEGTVRSDVFHGRRALRKVLDSWKDWKRED